MGKKKKKKPTGGKPTENKKKWRKQRKEEQWEDAIYADDYEEEGWVLEPEVINEMVRQTHEKYAK